MAFDPLDPTKAEVRVEQVADQLEFDFYIPRGAKGEPGGFNIGTDLATVNLNDIRVSGIYRLSQTQSGLLLRGFPKDVDSGVMTVYERVPGGSTVFQEWRSMLHQYRMLYVRTWDGGANMWSPWKTMTTHRVDQTAGRAIYQWDDLNNREQLVYGDTGWRDVSGDLLNGATGTALIRRIGNTVTFRIGALKLPSANVADVFYQCPTGFVTNLAFLSAREDVNTGQFTNIAFAGSVFLRNGTSLVPNNTTHRFSGSVTMMTDSVWPTTLPGVASGSIPNL